jgi:hypothetical protein
MCAVPLVASVSYHLVRCKRKAPNKASNSTRKAGRIWSHSIRVSDRSGYAVRFYGRFYVGEAGPITSEIATHSSGARRLRGPISSMVQRAAA